LLRGDRLILPLDNVIGLGLFLRCVLAHCFRGLVAHDICLSSNGFLTCGISVSPEGTSLCLFMKGDANLQEGSSKLTDLHFHSMIAVVILQWDGITRERLTVEG
jgi:hypothetical protein